MTTATMTARELAAQLRLRQATATIALQQAKRRVKNQVRAEGKRISDFSARELTILAEDYLAAHREELIPQARAWAEEFLTKRR